MMKKEHAFLKRWLACLNILYALASPVCAVAAGYLYPVVSFVVNRMIPALTLIGNSIAVVMFVYGAIKYAYTADDPGGRKQAMGICISAIVALIIISIADDVILAI
jgi:hypothetical protein